MINLLVLWKRKMNYIAVKNAIQHANKLHALTNKQYYVLKVGKKVGVFDRNKIDLLVNIGVFHKKMKEAVNIRKFSIYYTR